MRYPSDRTGEYVDLEGVVIMSDDEDDAFKDEERKVVVKTKSYGEKDGWTFEGAAVPPVGAIATIRCYRWGGGWYPDDRIVGWRLANEDDD